MSDVVYSSKMSGELSPVDGVVSDVVYSPKCPGTLTWG